MLGGEEGGCLITLCSHAPRACWNTAWCRGCSYRWVGRRWRENWALLFPPSSTHGHTHCYRYGVQLYFGSLITLSSPQTCANRLLGSLRENPYDCSLTRPLLWFLIARTQLTNEFPVNTELAVAMATLAVHSLKESCGEVDSLRRQSAMDCCSMVS